MANETISLTFGDQGENHVGMEKIGTMVERGNGFNITDLSNYKTIFEERGYLCEIHHLNELIREQPNNTEIENAYIMVIRNGIQCLLEPMKKRAKIYLKK
jgi:hypothetical protein